MSDTTDTPETAKARADYQRQIWSGPIVSTYKLVPAEDMQKIERERDELRKAIRNIISKGYIKADTPLLNALEDAERLLPENLNLASDEKLE